VPEETPVERTKAEAAFIRWLGRDDLPRLLVMIGVGLCLPALWLGFHLDDYIGRYIYPAKDELARKLFWLLSGGYGVANGVPADTHYQVEQGIAPWWTDPELHIELLRPFGVLLHWLDFQLWPQSAFLQHAHSLLWLGLLVLAVTRMYRAALGTVVGGLAALLFAIDHTHGFVVGYICNRHALITAVVCVLALERHLRERTARPDAIPWQGPLLYGLALLSGESALSLAGYLGAYALFTETTPWKQRVLSLLPYVLLTLGWRAGYDALGFGASGSGLYLDPGREPLAYLAALMERGPVLLLGMFFAPPAEAYMAFGPLGQKLMVASAWVVALALVAAVWPLWSRDRLSRCFALGMLWSLIPAASTFPHNRQLLFASFGALGLIAQLWRVHALEEKGKRVQGVLKLSGGVGAAMLLSHLVVSPLVLPVATWGVAITGPIDRAPQNIGDEVAGKDVVFMSAPDYFATKIVQLSRRIEGRPLPRRFRALSYGPQALQVQRADATTLIIDYEGGILGTPFLELYRDKRKAMRVGDRVKLEGLDIEVVEVTFDGRVSQAKFEFDTALDAESFVFYQWTDDGFARWQPPVVGASTRVAGAEMRYGL
jgi:hypothetical protein